MMVGILYCHWYSSDHFSSEEKLDLLKKFCMGGFGDKLC